MQQSGSVTVFVVIVMFLFGGILVQHELLIGDQREGYQHYHIDQLLLRREALLNYAITYADQYPGQAIAGPGHFPCPSQRSSVFPGSPEFVCDDDSARNGWLPRWIRQHEMMLSPNSYTDYHYRYLLAEGFGNNPIDPLFMEKEKTTIEIGHNRQANPVLVIADFSGSICRWEEMVSSIEGSVYLDVPLDCRHRMVWIEKAELQSEVKTRLKSLKETWDITQQVYPEWFIRDGWLGQLS